MSRLLIGLHGYAGAGKDTVAEYFNRMFGCERRAFAGALKDGLNAMFGWTMAQWDDRQWKEAKIDWLGKSPRELAQTLGTEWGREHAHPDIWLQLVANYWDAIKGHYMSRLVVTDVRFLNEAQWIRREGGYIVNVVRPGCEPIAHHVSNQPLPDEYIDIVLRNDASLNDLLHSVAAVGSEMLSWR